MVGLSWKVMELVHTYIFCNVRDGIAMTHAGHCKCNIHAFDKYEK